MPHTHQEDVKRFISHIMKLSGNSRTVPNWSRNGLKYQKKKTALLLFFLSLFYCGQGMVLGWVPKQGKGLT